MRKPHLRGRGPHIPPLDRVVQYDFEPGYVVFTQPCAKRVRVEVGGVTLADTSKALMLWETEHMIVYYLPLADIRMDLMTRTDHRTECPYKGTAEYYSVTVGGRTVENVMWRYANPIPACPPIAGYASFYWEKVDRVFEEDEEVFKHVRDPYRRIDCLPSSRLVEVSLDGVTLARSRRGVFMFETGMPTRFYLPAEDVTPGVLVPSDHTSRCPFKGHAGYHHVMVNGKQHDNIVWHYADPLPEVARIKDRVCFYNEFVDISVDGEPLPRPATAFSNGL